MESFLYQIISVGSYLFLSLIIGAFFVLQAKYHQPIYLIIVFLLSILKLIIFFAFFMFIDMQNLRAIYMRMSGTATTGCTIGDVVFFVSTILMAVLVLVSVILEDTAFVMYRKKEKASAQNRK